MTKKELYSMVKGQLPAAKALIKQVKNINDPHLKRRYEVAIKGIEQMEKMYSMQLNSLSHYYDKAAIEDDAKALESFIKVTFAKVESGVITVK